MTRAALPIDPALPGICAVLARGNLVLVAEPGAGKTTRVPPALIGGRKGGVVVLEPRRLAARMAAARVASELGDEVGGVVGYEVRFERKRSSRTRLSFVTEGLLARRLVGDPDLAGVDVVVLDEFHERHLVGDVALALVRRLQRERRPDLRIAVMSATMDPEPVARFLDAEVVRVTGRAFPVEIEYLAQPPDDHVDREVARAVRRLLGEGPGGDVLVFLPGAAEIGRCQQALAELAEHHDLAVLPLHGSLPAAAQDRAVAPAGRRKIVLATNVAETSLTIDGVTAVIDSGLARVPRHSPWSGVATLQVEAVSRASLTQRAGRAGRTRPGRCLRLFTRHDFEGRREADSPEILRSDLSDTVLSLHGSGLARPSDLAWFEPPPAAALEAADQLLGALGAVHADRLTLIGERMLRFPLHPRHARVLVEAEDRGVGRQACAAAALLGEHGIRRGGAGRRAEATSHSDLVDDLEAFVAARAGGLRASTIRDRGLDPAATFAADRAAGQLERLVDDRRTAAPADRIARERALDLALLAGYPDRVAQRRRAGDAELLLADGGGAVLAASSAVHGHDLLIALDAEERGKGRDRRVTVRSAHAIELDDLLELFLDRIEESDEVVFNPVRERVERVRRMRYQALVLEESRDVRDLDEAAAAAALAAAARRAGVARFLDPAALAAVAARLEVAARGGAGLAPISDPELDAALTLACDGARSFADVRQRDLLELVWTTRGAAARAALDRQAPEAVTLPGRKRVAVHYEQGRPPWIESRLQDFFGLREGPRVAGGAVAVTLHLLAPNGRAVQVTSDLESFWANHYPELRRQLMRRYPRHAWPEKP